MRIVLFQTVNAENPEEGELVQWINSKLAFIPAEDGGERKTIGSLLDLRDGTVIIHLLEFLTDQSVGIYSPHPRLVFSILSMFWSHVSSHSNLQHFAECRGIACKTPR